MKKLAWLAVGVALFALMTANLPARAAEHAGSGGAAAAATGQTGSIPTSRQKATDTNHAPVDEVDYVARAFSATQANVQGYLVHNWTELNKSFVSEEELTKTADEVKQELGIQNAKIVHRNNIDEHFYEIYGDGPNRTQVSVMLSSFRYQGAPASTVLIIRSESQSGSLSGLDSAARAMTKAVTNLQCTPQISACIEGFANARMGGVQTDRIVKSAFATVHAKKVEGVSSDLVTSMSGYSSDAPGYILTDGKKMNLQVAVHYDAYHHRTNILVGTPIITVTY